MKYSVDVSTAGGVENVVVEADTGDEAAAKAYKPGSKISNIQPYSNPPKPDLPKGVAKALKEQAEAKAEEAQALETEAKIQAKAEKAAG